LSGFDRVIVEGWFVRYVDELAKTHGILATVPEEGGSVFQDAEPPFKDAAFVKGLFLVITV